MRIRTTRQLGVRIAAVSLVMVICASAPAPERAGRPVDSSLLRHYRGTAIELTLDTTRLAIRLNDGLEGDAGVDGLAQVGFKAGDVQPYGVAGWVYARTPAGTDSRAKVEALTANVAKSAGVQFVSPVVIDETGFPMHATADVLVRFNPEVTRDAALATLRNVAPNVVNPDIDWGGMANAYRLRDVSASGVNVIAVANALTAMNGVRWAEVDWMMTGELLGGFPNDPSFPNCWAHENTGQVLGCNPCLGWNAPAGVVGMDMDTPEAWAITTGDPSIMVGIFDSGIVQTHNDISQVTPGYDFVNEGGDGGQWTACDTHGTAVAGAVSAIINNGIGGVGVAPTARSISMKQGNQGDDGMGNCNNNFVGFQASNVVDGLETCEDIGVRITNHSYGTGSSNAMADKFAETENAGIIHFASSGNGGGDNVGDPSLSFPASVDEVNAVAGLDPDGTLTGFSNYGEGLFISAPGVGVCGTGSCFCGTSASSPTAAGVAALVLSVNQSLFPIQVEFIMASTAMNLGVPGYDTTYGWGFVNAHAAVLEAIGCPGIGSCFEPHSSPGCSNPDCCAEVCAFDRFCCDVSWDGACVIEAFNICLGCPGDGACDEAHGGVGCNDAMCCQEVCLADSFCCDAEFGWDFVCVALAVDLCDLTPPNDDCGDRIPITGGYTPFSISNASNDGVSHFVECGWNAEFIKDVWFTYQAECTGFMMVTTCGQAPFDTWLAVYNNSACPPGVIPLLACSHGEPDCVLDGARITGVFVTQGEKYLIRVGALNIDQGSGELYISCEPLFDYCQTAFFLGDYEGEVNFNTRNAGTDGNPHAACSGGGNNQITGDVWFDWEATCTGTVTIQTCGSANFDTKIAIYDGCDCPATTINLLGCNDNAANCPGGGSRVSVPVTEGECYKIRVGGSNDEEGSGTFKISCANAPPNDTCEEAALTFLGIPTPFTTVNAQTDGLNHAACGGQIANDVWFKRTATCTGFMTVSTCGLANFNTKIAVYDGCECPATDDALMACNDNAPNCAGNGSRVTVSVIQGECYLVRIGSPFSTTGSPSGTGAVEFTCGETCEGDVTINGIVDVDDLLAVINAWGPCFPCGPICVADLTENCVVDVDDLLIVINNWGPCFPTF